LDIRGSIQEFERELIFDELLFACRLKVNTLFDFRLAGDGNDDDEILRELLL
jgi:hypothetical protein